MKMKEDDLSRKIIPLHWKDTFEPRKIEKWMDDALTFLHIQDVIVSYEPTLDREPVFWYEDGGYLVISEPDPFEAVLLFLRWAVEELPKQEKRKQEFLEFLRDYEAQQDD